MIDQVTAPFLDVGGFDEDPERARALPAHFYHDPAIFEQERRAIFQRCWQYAGHVSQLAAPGDYLTCEIGGQNIVILRGRDDEIRGFFNVCMHRGHELLDGAGHIESAIVCPYHAWTYELDGQLRGAPNAANVPGFDRAGVCLTPVAVETLCGLILVNPEREAPSFASQTPGLEADIRRLAPDIDELTLAYQLNFDIESNWKNVEDNFLESYHVPVAGDAHRGFLELIDYDTWRIEIHGLYQTQHAQARSGANSAYNIEGAEVMDHGMWWVWPNFLILRYPGDGNLMVWNQIPVAPGRTLQTFDFYFQDSTPNERQWEAIRYLDETLQPEDVAILESVQKGQQSLGYRQGYYMTDLGHHNVSEHGVHHFHKLVIEALTA